MDAKTNIQSKAHELGFSECRITSADPPDHTQLNAFDIWLESNMNGSMEWINRGSEKRKDPQLILNGAQSVVVLAFNYFSQSSQYQSDALIASYARYKDYHDIIGARLKLLSQFIDSLTGTKSRSLWYVDTGPILERSFAQRAGVGFVGKHTNLISQKLGNWFFIAEILTQAELEPDTSASNRCGKCTSCLDACPTQAFSKPFQLDARKCISYLTIEHKSAIPLELRPLMGNRIFGCDDCLQVCPWNRFAHQAHQLREYYREDLTQISLKDWLQMDDATFRNITRHTPLFRTRRNRILRNVCVAMGNSGQLKYLPDLEKATKDVDPLISEHAHWGITRIHELQK